MNLPCFGKINESYYALTAEAFGSPAITAGDYQKVQLINTYAGRCRRVLELGAGCGGAAAAAANEGHQVVAIELISARFKFLEQHARSARTGDLTPVLGDMHSVVVSGRFDAVCYWNGFGIGSDVDQRLLLTRVVREWLQPAGVLLMHVYPEPWWVRHAGTTEFRSAECFDTFEYDPVESRFVHTFKLGDRCATESIRCYSPADLRLLVEPTGLKVVEFFAESERVAASWKYGAVLAVDR